MSVAFRAPRAPIERPKPPSSRFSFYRRKRLIELLTYTIPFTSKSILSSIEFIPNSNLPLKSFSTRSLKEPLKLLRRPKLKKEDTPFDIYSIRVYTFRLLAKRAK